MKQFQIALMLIAAPMAAAAVHTVKSPDGLTAVAVESDAAGKVTYAVTHGGNVMLQPSPLGLYTNIGDFADSMRIVSVDTSSVCRHYTQSRIKHSEATYEARIMRVAMENAAGDTIGVEFSVSAHDVAYRYRLPRVNGGETGAVTVYGEASGFALPAGSTAFVTPQSDAMTGWKRTKPSYEEVYAVDVPVGTPSQYGHGFTLPALFRTSGGGWVLVGETGVDSRYVGSRLSDADSAGVYRIAFPMAEENNGHGSVSAAMSLPAVTPWRTITVGTTLAPIVETTVAWDLVEPLYAPVAEVEPARNVWSWILWQDGSINLADQKAYVDFAAAMGYDNVLVDNWWDTNIGREGIEELVRYAARRGVGVMLWYSSSGWWNDIVQGPVNVMSRSIERKKAMKWMHDIGIKGIKVDFFGGDKQETMRLYEDILCDANEYGIAVIFHGCTMPRGWERMYPNYAGSEAVLASENMIFSQYFADNVEAVHATLHPFIRNSLGSMEYGGTFLNRRLNRGNDGGVQRRTTDAFQLATAVLFQNSVQNFALAPNNLTDAPQEAIDFMKRVPTEWDETRFVDGYPGRYAVVARRSGSRWYIAGVSAIDHPVTLHLDLPMAAKGDRLQVLRDADAAGTLERAELAVRNPADVKIVLQPKGGFIIEK